MQYDAKGNPLALGLGNLIRNPDARNLYFNGEQIILDGYRWISCRFDNCVITVNSSNFTIENCIIDKSCRIDFGPEVVKVIKLYNSRHDWTYEHCPEFAPIRNLQNMITILG